MNVEQTGDTISNQYQETISGAIEQQQPSSPTSITTPTSSTSGGASSNVTPAFSYDDLFPALPANNTTPLSSSTAPACVRVTSSQKTQVSFLCFLLLFSITFI